MRLLRLRTAVAACAIAAAGTLTVGTGPALAQDLPTVVLVHGAFADTTSWDAVAAELRGRGYEVVVPDNPLRGPAYDSAAIEKVLADIPGPVVLVGHSYGGAVITNVHSPNVEALVYVAAFAPAQGEPVMLNLDPIRFPGSQLLPPVLQVKVIENDPTGIAERNLDGYIDPGRFHEVFAQDVPDATVADMIAHQKSAALVANLEPTADPSWASTPSWAMVAQNDRVIPAAAERFMATRAGARITEVSASHAVLVSQPGAVADLVVQADQGTP
ncbi:alpha/beta fold hydrolase [Rhodococcus opacus]|uniref:alpha/beta fold hydrolase n=1 Tax=Rhodococcus opacus TaxID=37919 RepID=UPI000EA8DBDD|nr:alpha/beta hydrolase [Rhodococcus opacus]QZS55006.1 alpha/beta hydrolase [Rhodococcus opacus]RKM71921.1 hydrolase [Rhodococcus opacus]UZG57770.1 alpha/beta hydrolase [Rhodococcus opacus]